MTSTESSRSFGLRVAMLALPIALQMLLQSFLGMADVIMVSGLGSAAIAAVGLSAKLHFLLWVLMAGIATGCSVLIAQYTGAKDTSSGAKTLAVTFIVAFAVMLPCVMLFAVNNTWWLRYVNPDREVVSLAAQYLLITAPALIFTQFVVIYESSLRATGNATLPLATGIFAAVANVVLNYILIFGHFGFPEMGVAGAAWGTMISRLLQLMAIAGCLHIKKHPFAPLQLNFNVALHLGEMKKFIFFSLPLVSNYLIWAIGNAAYHILTGYAGTEALAVMGVIVPIETAFFALFVGLASASAVMIGHALGAGDNVEAWRLYKFFDRLSLVLVLVLSLVLWLSTPWLVKSFYSIDNQTATLLQGTLAVFCLLTWVKVTNMMRIIGVLRAGADNNFVLVTDTIVMWLIGLPIFIVAVFSGKLSFVALYALMYVEDFAKFIPMWLRIGKRKWLKNLTSAENAT